MDTSILTGLMNDLENTGTICLAGHQNPDGDAVGACFALALAINMFGKRPVILLERFSERYNFLKGKEFLHTGEINADTIDCDVFISLDCASKERLGASAPIFDKARVTYNFDHHVSNAGFAAHNCIEPEASSTCELIYEVINHIAVVDRDIAAALYTGVVFDTGSFFHACTTPKTHSIAARLLTTGIDFSDIHRRIVYEHSEAEARIFGTALLTLKILPEAKLAYVTLSEKQMKDAGATSVDLDGIVEYMLNLRGVETSALITERGSSAVKASLRSKALNVSQIAARFGGGGHINAAGATLECGIEEAVKKVVNEIANAVGASRNAG